MESIIQFDINESLKQYLSDHTAIQTPDADSALVDCEADPESLTLPLINPILNSILDAVAESPDALVRSVTFDSLQYLLKCAPITPSDSNYISNSDFGSLANSRSSPSLPPQALSKILDVVVCGLSLETDLIHSDHELEDNDSIHHHKQLLEAYAFLLQWTIAAIEMKAAEKSASTSASAIRGRGGKGGKSKAVKDSWDAAPQIQSALDLMSKVLKLRIQKLFPTTSERDTFVSLFTRAVYLVLESEIRVKTTAIRMHSFKVLCVAIKHHGHAYGKYLAFSSLE